MSMSLLPEHFRDDHHLDYVQCPADEKLCGQNVPWHKFLQHIVTHHGRLPCEFCSRICMVNEMHNHMTKECSASYYHLPKGSNETILSKKQENSPPTQTHVYKPWTNWSLEKIRKLRQQRSSTKCPQCQKMVHNIARHVRKWHMKKVPCEVCSDLVSQNLMENHLKTHENEVYPVLKLDSSNDENLEQTRDAVSPTMKVFDEFGETNIDKT